MGGMNSKSEGVEGTNQPVPQNQIICCLDCTPLHSSIGKDTNQEKQFEQWSHTLQSTKNGSIKPRCSVVPNCKKWQTAQSQSSESLGQCSPKSLRRASLTFAGTIPDDWSEEQQSKLQSAVAEVARRSRLRFPGHNEMQVEVSAQALKKRQSSWIYGTRCFPAS